MAVRGARNSVWFSTHFGVNKPQHLLPFLDFLLERDVPLYIDSYAITKDRSEFAARCHDAIISYFQALLEAVQSGQPERIKKLVQGHLSEPRELHLGFATVARTGLGLGRIQEAQIVEALTQSQALRTGFIQDIQELEPIPFK